MWPFTSHKARRRAPAYRPRLEGLEDRCLLSAGALDPTVGTGGLATADFLGHSWDRASAVALQADGRLVLQPGEHVVAERGDEEAPDQLGGQPPATAVPEHDVVVLRDRQGAGPDELGTDRRAGIGRVR